MSVQCCTFYILRVVQIIPVPMRPSVGVQGLVPKNKSSLPDCVFHHFAGGTATRLSKAEQDLQRWGPSLRPGSWAASLVGSPRPPSQLRQPSAPSPASSNPGAHAAALTSQALQAGAHSGSRPEQLIEDPGHVTMGQSRHSNGAAEAVNQTTLSAGQRQSSVLARLLGHKLEIQVGFC